MVHIMICSNIIPQKVISKTMIEILIEPFKYEFMVRSTITAIASGTMLSLLGPFAINRNMGFMADAMAHATLPIIAVGVFLGFSISELGVPAQPQNKKINGNTTNLRKTLYFENSFITIIFHDF